MVWNGQGENVTIQEEKPSKRTTTNIIINFHYLSVPGVLLNSALGCVQQNMENGEILTGTIYFSHNTNTNAHVFMKFRKKK